jgi:putative addiction module component (TIGR02574 family)
MRLLVDAQLAPTLTQSFVSKGQDAVHVAVCDESLPSRPLKLDFLRMATIAEVEKLALDLPETERTVLAAHLLRSLPSVLYDEDEGVAEALRRDAEFEANPSPGMSLEELDQRIESRRS